MIYTLLLVVLQLTVWPVFAHARHQNYGKLIDGQQTDISKFPYQVALLYGGKLTCGGSIIDKKWILTAAHCTFRRNHELFEIRVGSNSATSGGVLYEIANIYEHPKFNFAKIDFDIGLIELETELELTDKVQIIELADYEPPVRAYGVVTGWGITGENVPFASPVIRSVEVPIVRRLTCNFRYFFKVTDRMICAGYTFGGKNICKGDSGGPLVYQGKQVGIVSWAAGCARPISPGVFTNVPNLKDYVRAVTKLEI